MDPPQKAQTNLFDVYLRLRPPQAANAGAERFILVDEPEEDDAPTHITLNPPHDRRRQIENFAFTRVFEEHTTQLDLFYGIKVLPLVEGALAPHGGDGVDGLLATLGMTGSGKTHTMLGNRSQRGLTQLVLDVLFRSVQPHILDCSSTPGLEASIRSSEPSEAVICPASSFLECVFGGDVAPPSRAGSRATTPVTVRPSHVRSHPQLRAGSPRSVRLVRQEDDLSRVTVLSTPPSQMSKCHKPPFTPLQPKLADASSPNKHYMILTSATKNKNVTKACFPKGDSNPPLTLRRPFQRPSALPQTPDISSVRASCDPSAEYAVMISTYEVYNNKIYDLLAPPIRSNATKEYRRQALPFKHTETSPDRKVVAGLRKVMCHTLQEALMVLEAGLHERRVAATNSNSVSSRSHGFFCIELKRRRRGRNDGRWGTNTLTIVDLAGSERARDAKTQGASLVEGGKINESLMYLGQCLQAQTDLSNNAKSRLGPFRQCKLTEILFSNLSPTMSSQSAGHRRAPLKAMMIVTADPMGDFNATSQILRYSALAREVTVPRFPSITSTTSAHGKSQRRESVQLGRNIVASAAENHQSLRRRPSGNNGRTPSPVSDEEADAMEDAALEIAQMADVIDQLNDELARESEARMAAEAHLMSTEDRMQDLEQEIREECYADFEHRLALEMNRWKASLSHEQERGEAHWDRKVEVLARSVGVVVTAPSDDDEYDEDTENEDKENVLIENLEQENERLRREIAVLKRELSGKVPGKRAPLQERADLSSSKKSEVSSLGDKVAKLKVGDESPTKKMRKLATRKWAMAMDDDPF